MSKHKKLANQRRTKVPMCGPPKEGYREEKIADLFEEEGPIDYIHKRYGEIKSVEETVPGSTPLEYLQAYGDATTAEQQDLINRMYSRPDGALPQNFTSGIPDEGKGATPAYFIMDETHIFDSDDFRQRVAAVAAAHVGAKLDETELFDHTTSTPLSDIEKAEVEEALSHSSWAPKVDLINHPPHYTQGKIEVLDFIEDQKLPYHLASVVKYLCRAPYKGTEEQDLRKALFYLNRYIEMTFDEEQA